MVSSDAKELMRTFAPGLCLMTAAMIAASSCAGDRRESSSVSSGQETTHPLSAPPDAPRTADLTAGGTIHGLVRFRGRPPRLETIDFSSNPQCERQHLKSAVKTETVVVNANGTLRNALVWLKTGVPAGRWQMPDAAVALDQAGCVYRPHVVALMVGQELEILNSDPVNHDVHVESVVNAGFNVAEPPRAESLQKRFSREEVWFPVTCSVHPWMRSWVAVIRHPFFAVTGADGSFVLKGVPPGQYTVEAVTEAYGRKQVQLSVEKGQSTAAEFRFGE